MSGSPSSPRFGIWPRFCPKVNCSSVRLSSRMLSLGPSGFCLPAGGGRGKFVSLSGRGRHIKLKPLPANAPLKCSSGNGGTNGSSGLPSCFVTWSPSGTGCCAGAGDAFGTSALLLTGVPWIFASTLSHWNPLRLRRGVGAVMFRGGITWPSEVTSLAMIEKARGLTDKAAR